MKPNTQDIIQISAAFATTQTKYDLVKTLNLAKQHLYGNKAKDITLRQLTYYADPRIAKNRYTEFLIPKKRGGRRTIHAPVPGLKAILRCLNFVLQCTYGELYEDAVMGFVKGRSVKDNADRHTCKQYVYNIDLQDFFPSIELYRVKAIFKHSPFNLVGDREPLAFLIANLCCESMEVLRPNEQGDLTYTKLPVLPQGAPTSPTITNFIARTMDRRLKGASKRFGATYTRYADDITFSSNHNLYGKSSEFLVEIRRIITDQGFRINESKVRLQQPWYRQEVTGVIVNQHVNVARKYVKQLRQWLYLWETYGYEKATLFFKRDYVSEKPRKIIPSLDQVIEGKLQYMKMIVGEEHPTWQKLKARFSLLAGDQLIEDTTIPSLDEELEKLFLNINKDIIEYLAALKLNLESDNENAIEDEEAAG